MIDLYDILFGVIGALIVFIVPPYLDGISRRVKARIQYRIGPPLSQTWYDLRKLFGLPSVLPTDSGLFKWAPYLALASALTAAFMLPFGGYALFNYSNNLIVFFYVVVMVSVFLMLAGFSVQNAFSHIGSTREMTLLLTVEPLLAVVYGVFAYNSGSLNILGIAMNLKPTVSLVLAYIVLFYALYMESGFVPFDVAEAEQEVIGGPLAEYSGRLLGVFYYAIYIKRFTLLWLFSTFIVLPFCKPLTPEKAAIALPLQLLIVFGLYPVIASLEATNARLRIDHIVKTNVKVFFISLAILAMAFVGW
ncbi:MAG: respiratory chain complex I subunit 1 family protein [Desulfurococcales archaeon]|nr:respiratory chain complex I subunit 1 family protein [Desulfurococcales archaeon]